MRTDQLHIVIIVPGSGDAFYCGNCFRDSLYANALRQAGHEVTVMPLYLPLRDTSFQADAPLFFPATSLYMQQKYFRLKAMPHWLERLMNSDFSLRRAAAMSGSTSANGLEDMTLSMIEGKDEVFRREMAKLVDWLCSQPKPDLIHLSSSLLIGLAPALRDALPETPVVCSLQDEEVWIDVMPEADAQAAWQGIAAGSRHIARFVASSHYYKNFIERRLPVLQGRIDVVYPGVDTAKYASDDYPAVPTLGFFYHMNAQDGLDILAEAFVQLKQADDIPHLRLRIGGGYSPADKPFLRSIRRLLQPYQADVDWVMDYSPSLHPSFYRSVSAICVPIKFNEGAGLYLCEAFAAGRPAIEPHSGSFAEIAQDAAILYQPNTPDALAQAIRTLFLTDGQWELCHVNALLLSRHKYNYVVQAQKLIQIYQTLLSNL